MKHGRLATITLRRVSSVIMALMLSCITGCLEEPGPLDMSDPDALDDALGVGLRDPTNPILPIEPDPFQAGDERLSVGYLYEGDSSLEILLNTVSTDFFVFAIDIEDPIATRSFTENTSEDRLEGLVSYEVTLNGSPFWGGGIVWFEPIDLSDWTTMFVGFKSSDPSFAEIDIGMQSGVGDEPSGPAMNASTYGYTNDGEWHFLEIPLQDFVDRGLDLTTVRSPFIMSRAGGEVGDVLLVDNLYFTKD